MIRPAMVHARLLLSRSYAAAASGWPLLVKRLPLHGHGCPHYQMYTGRRGEIKMLSRRWCHGFPENQELADKSCAPCNSKDMHAMSEDTAKMFLEQVNGWELTTEGDILKLHRAWKVKNFTKGLEFLQLVATIAEAEGGLTDNDFILAAKINNLKLQDLLSKKANVQK